jgi:flagellar FliL protein
MAKTNETPQAQAQPSSKAESPPAKGRKKTLTLLAALVLILLAGAGGAWWFIFSTPPAAAEAAPDLQKAKPPVFVSLEPFTVNLQSEAGDRYLQVELVLKVQQAQTSETIKLHMPEIRSRIILLLSSKKAEDLSTTAGKQRLSQDILEEFGQIKGLQHLHRDIGEVLFTSFVIQ